MACSEEVDWGVPKEEQQSEAEETDSYTYETISEHQESEENDTNPYTYESFSDSSDDSSAVPAASSKYKARPVKSIESEQSTSSRTGGSSDAMDIQPTNCYRALEHSEASSASMTARRIFHWQHDSCSMWFHIRPHRRE